MVLIGRFALEPTRPMIGRVGLFTAPLGLPLPGFSLDLAQRLGSAELGRFATAVRPSMAGTLELDKLCKVGLPPRAMALLELPEDSLFEVQIAGTFRDHAPLLFVVQVDLGERV